MMTASKVRDLLNALLDNLFVALLLSAGYPAVFLLSKNWYAFEQMKILYLLVFICAAALGLYAGISLLVKLVELCAERARGDSDKWRTHALEKCAIALLCCSVIFLFMYGTIEKALKVQGVIVGAFAVCVALLAWVFLRSQQRYYAALLAILIAVSLAEWGYTYALIKVTPAVNLPHLSEKAVFQGVTWSDKPNIFVLFYDAYGNRGVMKSLFNLDNSALYEVLEGKGFKTHDSFSNYSHSWPTVLATFLANHHYLALVSGNFDTKYGRSIMAGIAYNPVLSTLKNNGYKVQYIHRQPYFTKENGVLDFNYPHEPAFSALRVFENPIFNSVFGEEKVFASTVSLETQTEVFMERLTDMYTDPSVPWFTFSYFHLPGHFPVSSDWRSAGEYEKTFREKVRKANDHIQTVVARILEFDRDAVIIIMGDHGSWRYRNVWNSHEDPNRSFEINGVSAETVGLDIFGIMVAVYSAGRCDDDIYETITPVNIMRAVFACLSGTQRLLTARPPDISMFSGALWLTAKDGKPLKLWKTIRPPGMEAS